MFSDPGVRKFLRLLGVSQQSSEAFPSSVLYNRDSVCSAEAVDAEVEGSATGGRHRYRSNRTKIRWLIIYGKKSKWAQRADPRLYI